MSARKNITKDIVEAELKQPNDIVVPKKIGQKMSRFERAKNGTTMKGIWCPERCRNDSQYFWKANIVKSAKKWGRF